MKMPAIKLIPVVDGLWWPEHLWSSNKSFHALPTSTATFPIWLPELRIGRRLHFTPPALDGLKVYIVLLKDIVLLDNS